MKNVHFSFPVKNRDEPNCFDPQNPWVAFYLYGFLAHCRLPTVTCPLLTEQMENFSFQYPAWYLLLCVLLGLVYALSLYYKDKTFVDQHPNLHKILGVIRFLAVSLLAMLLLKPLLKSLFTETKKPVIVLAQDQSESVGAAFKEGEFGNLPN